MQWLEGMIQDAIALNAARAAIVEVEKIEFSMEFRKLCEQNKCGMSGTNWMCPPGVGPYETLKERAQGYNRGLVFQTVHSLKSSFDLKGMTEGAAKHSEVFRNILDMFRTSYNLKDILPLNAGPCTVCKECSYKESKPCRFPQKAIASIEAYGIDVMKLARTCKIPYNNGSNTVSYVSMILFEPKTN